MTQTATVRIMSAEEIAARGGGDIPFAIWPERDRFFAEREMRLRQLATTHSMGEFLQFMAQLCKAQQQLLDHYFDVALPDDAWLDQAAQRAVPPLSALDWSRDAAWRSGLRQMLDALIVDAPAQAATVMRRLQTADDVWLEAQADCLLTGVTRGLDFAAAPLIAGALQVYFTHLVLAVQSGASKSRGRPFGRIDDEAVCPCCGSRPVASITRTAGEFLGQRYLQCSLCGTQWHMVRIRCTHCLSEEGIAYQSLQHAGAEGAEGVSVTAVQAETCDRCQHYLKIMHTDRDPQVDAVADDLASLPLDLLVSEAGLQRHGVNLMLLFGDPDAAAPSSDPGRP